MDSINFDNRLMIENMNSGFALFKVITDKANNPVDFVYLDINNAYAMLTGLKKEDILNKRITGILPDKEKSWIQQFGRVAITGETFEVVDYLKESNQYFATKAYCPKPGYFAVTFNEITELKRTEKKLRSNQIELQKKNEAHIALNEELIKTNRELKKKNIELAEAKQKADQADMLKISFLTNLSHEIRTPLNGICGFLGLLDRNLSDEKFNLYTSIIQKSSDQLIGIINNIIDLSKIETGTLVIAKRELNINEMLENLNQEFQAEAIEKKIKLSLEMDRKELYISTDPTKVTQIFSNLLNNAIKFTEQGEINFGYLCKNGTPEFFVADTGIGIEEKNQNLVFNYFYQVESTGSRVYRGAGIGLSLVKSFIEKLGGKIWFDSVINKGTRFHFILDGHTLEQPPTPKLNEAETIYTWLGKKILLVEDDRYNQQLIVEMTADAHPQLLVANNGIEALELLKNNPDIDVVILDIKMPKMDGFETITELKKINKNLPVIGQTAHAFIEDKMRMESFGFDEFLVKPVKMEKLMNTLNKYLKKDKL